MAGGYALQSAAQLHAASVSFENIDYVTLAIYCFTNTLQAVNCKLRCVLSFQLPRKTYESFCTWKNLSHTSACKTNVTATCLLTLQPKYFKGKYQDTNNFVKLPLQVATEREIARQQYSLAGQSLADWTVRLKDFPHPALNAASLVGQVIGPFLFAASMFSYVPVVNASASFFAVFAWH